MTIIKIPPITDIVFTAELDVRIYDVNYGNHLGHDSLISLLHEARFRYLKHHGYSELNIHGLGMLVTGLAVNYVGEAFYADKLAINIGFGELGKASVDFIYQVMISDKNKEVARAVTSITFYDYQNKKVARIPEEFLAVLKMAG